MKRFLKIFIFLEIILFVYIFNTSIYNIYEKNNRECKIFCVNKLSSCKIISYSVNIETNVSVTC